MCESYEMYELEGAKWYKENLHKELEEKRKEVQQMEYALEDLQDEIKYAKKELEKLEQESKDLYEEERTRALLNLN